MIISVREEGLANRMKSLVSCFRMEPEDAWVYWNPFINIYLKQGEHKVRHRAPTEFNDLFKNEISIKPPFPKGALIYDSWRLKVLSTDKLESGFSISKFSDADESGRNIDFEYTRIPKKIRFAYINEFEKLEIQDNLKKRIDKEIEEIDGEFVSVHFRNWVDVAGAKRRDFSQLNKFISEMTQYPRSTKFFLGSDSWDNVQRIKQQFPGRVYALSGEKTQQDDLVDLYVLSKGSEIIGTKDSTFSEVCWYLSKCNKRIKIL